MEPSGSGSGSGAAEPVEDDRIQEPVSNGRSNASSSNGAPSAAAPPPPCAMPLDLERPRREQAGGGADGSISAVAGVDRKGKGTPATPSAPSSAGRSSSSSSSSSAPSLDHAAAPFIAGAFIARGRGVRARLTWSDPLVSAAREEPDAAFEQRLAIEQAAVVVANALWKRQVTTIAMLRPARGVSLYSLGMLKSFREEEALEQKEQIRRQGREICSEHVKHQTHPITEVRRHHKLASDEANHLDAYSECRSVIDDGECFYRSFIFSYLEQVIDRQDTHEEHHLLHVVDIEHLHHGALRWNSEFSRSSRAFKDLIEKVMRWKSHGRWKGMESTSSYRKEELLEFFSEYDTTQDTIQICWHNEVYEPLIPGLRGNYNLEDWCFQRVTPARRFTDHVMMLALARALEVPLRVERVRGGYDPDIYTGPGVPRPRVTLLYSANHYEIIYRRAPSAESSSHQASQIENAADQVSSQHTSQGEHPGDESSSE